MFIAEQRFSRIDKTSDGSVSFRDFGSVAPSADEAHELLGIGGIGQRELQNGGVAHRIALPDPGRVVVRTVAVQRYKVAALDRAPHRIGAVELRPRSGGGEPAPRARPPAGVLVFRAAPRLL